MRSRYILVLLIGLVAGLAVGAAGAWSTLKGTSGLDERIAALDARLRDLEAAWPDVPALEARLEQLTRETAAIRARAEQPTGSLATPPRQELEDAWGARFEVLERRLETLANQMAATARRADELARRVAEARPAGAESPEATPPPRADLEGTPATSTSSLRMRGVIRRGDTRTALVEDAQNEGYLARVGDALPQGRVVEINDDTVVIEKASGARVTLRMVR